MINIFDPLERNIPDIGLVRVRDAESGTEKWVDTSSKSVRNFYRQWGEEAFKYAKQLFNRFKVDSVSIGTNEDYVKGLMTLFKSH